MSMDVSALASFAAAGSTTRSCVSNSAAAPMVRALLDRAATAQVAARGARSRARSLAFGRECSIPAVLSDYLDQPSSSRTAEVCAPELVSRERAFFDFSRVLGRRPRKSARGLQNLHRGSDSRRRLSVMGLVCEAHGLKGPPAWVLGVSTGWTARCRVWPTIECLGCVDHARHAPGTPGGT